MKILIIGLGLMGGSMALSLKNGKFSVSGQDIGENAKSALELGLVDKIAQGDINADIIVLAMPIDATKKWLESPPKFNAGATIIDLCSAKRMIIDAAKNIRTNFVAAHPMCGTEYSGPKAALDGLYNGKTVVLCDLENSGEEHVLKAIELFSALNMKIERMSADLHDKHAAFISHLPHLLSFALANAVLSQESPEDILTMAAGGFKDMSRLAKSSPELWEQIFFANADEVLRSIDIFSAKLLELKKAIESKDAINVLNEMRTANGLYQLFER